MKAESVKKELQKFASPKKANFLQRYFKTGKGEYAEGDIFLGLTVPETRKVAKIYKDLDIKETKKLLSSKTHEERQVALMILSLKTNNADINKLKQFNKFYLENLSYVNNWDLVDGSAENLVGKIILENPNHIFTFKGEKLKGGELLEYLAKSENIWERRVAIISTFKFIKNNKFETSLKISKTLLSDNHDLIHKAVGWMLREIGKRDEAVLLKFIKENYSMLARTTLRYAIERFPENKRKRYLKGEF